MKPIYLLSLFGSLLCIFLAPIQSYIWNAENSPTLVWKIQANIQGILDIRRTNFPESSDYYFFGRLFLPVYLGILFGLKELKELGRIPEQAKKEFKVFFIFLSIAAFGNFLAYWVAGFAGEGFRTAGFRWIEAPSILILLIVAILIGRKIIRERKTLGLAFLILPILMIGSTMILKYLPHAAILPISLLVTFLLLDASQDVWLNSLKRQLVRFSSAKSILSLFMLGMFCAICMQVLEKFIPMGEEAKLPVKPDFLPFSSISDLQSVFSAYGERGRELYIWMDLIDMIFPTPLAFAIGATVSLFASRIGISKSWGLIPFGFLLFDILENICMLIHVYTFPDLNSGLASISGIFTAYKLFFLLCSYSSFAISLLGLLILSQMSWKSAKA
ncbi:hypothetical protein EHO59_01015 [Leptospira semungkisensis]|uniref:Uncharacterized protein n=1 Tax=Leptospira semungkisensis TaxID=2484985 RepID=A0A4R9G5B8_9LEPT|nr:hypothetical protein [Leptospira semungkisensis]TGK06746.1 hypothetical protein EHO59_01015 [Leptospira semungkisensis]